MKKLSLIFIALRLYFLCIRVSTVRFFTYLTVKKSVTLSSAPVVFLCRRYEALLKKQRTGEKRFLHMLFNMKLNLPTE